MKQIIALTGLLLLLNACTVVQYQGLAQSKDGGLNISGQETGFSSDPKAVILECAADGNQDYICNKRYPGTSVDLFGNTNTKRASRG